MQTNIIWQPQPKQSQFMRRPEFEALYGGAAGGGKSDALLAEALRQIGNGNYRALLLRKTYPQLRELIDRSRVIYGAVSPSAKYNDSKHEWIFPSGAKIIFGSLNHPSDRYNYQGHQYAFIGFDELTHFTYDEYMYLHSRCRCADPDIRCYIRATANPGGIGHAWVKQRFITAAEPLKTVTETVFVEGYGEVKRNRVFVPSTVFDNAALLKNNPEYIANLASLPEAERNALLYGNWDSFSGQVFTEWRNDPEHYADGKFTHIINPFKIPSFWQIIRCFDHGYTKPYACEYIAVDPDGKMYICGEVYGGNNNIGVKQDPTEIAKTICEYERAIFPNNSIIGVADPAIFDRSRGNSVADMMAKPPYHLNFIKGDNNRLPGKMQYHYRLAFDSDGDCMMQVFSTCKHFIRTIPDLIYSDTHPEDIDTDGEDHIYDAVRYGLMTRIITPKPKTTTSADTFDPLNINRKGQR